MQRTPQTSKTVQTMQTDEKPLQNGNKIRRTHKSGTHERASCCENSLYERRHVVFLCRQSTFFMANEAPALLNAFKVPMCPVEAFLESAANEFRSKVFIFSPHQDSFQQELSGMPTNIQLTDLHSTYCEFIVGCVSLSVLSCAASSRKVQVV